MGICASSRKKAKGSVKPQIIFGTHKSPSTSPLESVSVFVQKDNLQSHYTLNKIVGSGFFGNVRRAYRSDGTTKEKFAVKSIAKERLSSKKLLKVELETLRQVDHPNIIKLYEIYEDDHYIHLVMELCTGGELFDRIMAKSRFSEAETASLIYKTLHAVNYLHNSNISHRDLKPENILYKSLDEDAEIKLIDFGLAHKFAEGKEMHSMVGTPYYVAPEVLRKQYGPECDIWSIGVLMYFLLSGTLPFDGDSRTEIYNSILSCQYSFEFPIWDQISSEAIALVKELLNASRTERISAAQAMEHPWFSLMLREKNTSKLQTKVLRRLSRNQKSSSLRSDVLNFITRHLKGNELKSLNHIFRSIDREHTGFISLDEFEMALQRVNLPCSDEVRDIFLGMCRQGSDQIEYSIFLTAAMDRRILYDKEIRWMTFKFFDVGDRGYITVQSMKSALEKLEISASEDEVFQMIQEAGIKYEKWIDFQEFCKILDPLPGELSSLSGSVDCEK